MDNRNKNKLEMGRLLKHFEAFNLSEGKSRHTIDWYNQAVGRFSLWIEAEGRSTCLGAVGEDEVREYILYLRNKTRHGHPLSLHTINTWVRAIRSFFHWLAEAGYTEDHLLARLKPPKMPQRLIDPLTAEEIGKLFSSLNQKTVSGARDHAILSLFLDTGLRISELAHLKEADAYLEERYVKVLGKGNKERLVSMGASCQRSMLHYYYHFRPELAFPGCGARCFG